LRLYWDWHGAEQEIRRALALDPGLPVAHFTYAMMLVASGRRDEALAHALQARHLAGGDLGLQTDLGLVLYFARVYDQAARQLAMVVEMAPDYAPAHKYLTDVYLQQGRYAAAAEQFRTWLQLVGVDSQESAGAAAEIAHSGRTGIARRLLGRRSP